MSAELTPEESEELNALHYELSSRTVGNSIIRAVTNTIDLDVLRANKDLKAMKFYSKFLKEGFNSVVVRAAYNAATVLGEDPMEYMNDDRVSLVKEFVTGTSSVINARTQPLMTQLLADYCALVLRFPSKVNFLIELVITRGVIDPKAAEDMLDASTDTPTPLTGGTL